MKFRQAAVPIFLRKSRLERLGSRNVFIRGGGECLSLLRGRWISNLRERGWRSAIRETYCGVVRAYQAEATMKSLVRAGLQNQDQSQGRSDAQRRRLRRYPPSPPQTPRHPLHTNPIDATAVDPDLDAYASGSDAFRSPLRQQTTNTSTSSTVRTRRRSCNILARILQRRPTVTGN